MDPPCFAAEVQLRQAYDVAADCVPFAAMGLDPQRASFRMAGRAMVSAIDEAAIYWLQNGEPFDIDVLVDWMVETASFGVRAAERLDAPAAVKSTSSAGV
jgi:hypothetical protein